MKTKPFLSVLPLVFLLACSIEDPDTGLPKSENKDPVPKEEPPTPEEEETKDPADTESPSVPSDVKITEKSFESLSLSWTASTDNDKVAHYLVFLDDTQAAKVTSTTSSLVDLTPGQKYSLTVKAVDPSGNTSESSQPVEETTLVDTEAPSVPTETKVSGSIEGKVTFTWTASSDNAGVKEYDIFVNGEFFTTTEGTEYLIPDLVKGLTYSFSVLARDIYGNTSEKSPEVTFTTETEAPPITDADPEITKVFFSEYIEGSSNNKALEIANISTSTIDLGVFSIKKIANQNEEWRDEKKLEGTLAPGEVYVIAHSKAAPEMVQQADLIMGGGIIAFNGNDRIGLFREGNLIDIIGDSGGNDFAKDVTLRRKLSATVPSIIFNPEDWEVLEIDSFDGLGKL